MLAEATVLTLRHALYVAMTVRSCGRKAASTLESAEKRPGSNRARESRLRGPTTAREDHKLDRKAILCKSFASFSWLGSSATICLVRIYMYVRLKLAITQTQTIPVPGVKEAPIKMTFQDSIRQIRFQMLFLAIINELELDWNVPHSSIGFGKTQGQVTSLCHC